MTNNNDNLDDFFKKKDKKSKKSTKLQLLTNNEELLKQLVAVTTHEQQEFDDDDIDLPTIAVEPIVNHPLALLTEDIIDEPDSVNAEVITEDNRTVIVNPQPFAPTKYTNFPVKKKVSSQQSKTPTVDSKTSTTSNQDDEWEEFPEHDKDYNRLRNIAGDLNAWIADQDDNDYYYADENQSEGKRDQPEQQQKPAWKLDNLVNSNGNEQHQQREQGTKISPIIASDSAEKQQVEPVVAKGRYIAPHQRSGASINTVEKPHRKPSSKVLPYLQSTEEFPTLASAMTNMKLNEKNK
ncbi:unnamed protein product [Didymodactylos carnosus]|uniref:Uncharacterized protein n=1 Tax=Didymodactylos carnosus TaxID=1234261 RepID=A0A814FVZ8_9BILA|nr:unnamed protein product [Didymodactylos carnosus]CAF0986564.1 unnamed protein product [Didymodactylos carnosus]CAF3615293.1 unnamed protein product [Didymodactylos carnosus]CAF3758823.1 unnamed protein product [Didymodactylos carnosus]